MLRFVMFGLFLNIIRVVTECHSLEKPELGPEDLYDVGWKTIVPVLKEEADPRGPDGAPDPDVDCVLRKCDWDC